MKKKIGNTEFYIDLRHITRLIIPVLIIVLIIVFIVHLFSYNRKADYSTEIVNENLKTVETFDFSSVAAVNARVETLNDREKPAASASSEKGKYKALFNGSIILGDSVTEGLTEYGYLGNDVVFSKIGSSIKTSKDLFDKSAAVYPKNAFFAMGMNDMERYEGDSAAFIKDYRALIEKFMKKSPDTKIFVCTISKPGRSAIAKNHYLGNYRTFCEAIKQMCSEMNITCIDVTDILRRNPGLYQPDGIHAKPGYYPIWLNRMAEAANLK